MQSTTAADWSEPAVESMVFPGSRSGRDPDRAIKPGRHGLTAERVAEIQRGRLIDGFVEVVAEHGFPNVTIGMVCDAAGVTKKTFYVFFPTMQDCFLAAYSYGAGLMMSLMRRAYLDADGWADGLRAGLRVMLKALADEPAFARVSMVEVNAAGPRVRAARNECLRRFREFFADPDYGMPPIAEPLVDAVIGGIYSSVYMRIEVGETEKLPDLLPTLTYFAFLPLVGKDAAAREL